MRIGSDKDTAVILGISTVRLKARISAGAPVPPFMKVPGSKFRRWDLDGVEEWMATFTVGVIMAPDHEAPIMPTTKKRGRGRPRKTAQKIV
ncbi:MAG: hypothetical protein ACYCQM_14965 [Acidithiobacillus sp.]